MTTSPAFTPAELSVWSSLATLLEWLPAELDAQLQRDSQMSHFEFGLLYALRSAPKGTLRMSELANYANSTLSRLSRAAVRLEKRGWIRREPDPEDGRFTLAILLEPGRSAVSDAEPGHVALVREVVLDAMTSEQADTVRDAAKAISARLRPGASWTP